MSPSRASPDGRHALWGNVAMLLALAAIAGVLARWNAGDWWIATPGKERWMWAGASVVLYVGLSAWLLRRAARRDMPAAASADVDHGDVVWIVHASQTGFAVEIAGLSATSLEKAGMQVRRADLGRLTSRELATMQRVLFVVSTTGEGDAPDPAIPFVRRVMSAAPSLAHLHYAVLALGDREYEHFCAFGHQFDDWLRRLGATPLFDLVEVDNADESALRHWQHHLGHLADSPDLPDWSMPRYERWTLAERAELNPGSVGGPVFHLALTRDAASPPQWLPGDIAEVGPRHSTATVEAWMEAAGLPRDTFIESDGGQERLVDRLAASQLPALADLRGRSPQAIAQALTPLPHREYSIASLPHDGSLHLLVRRMTRADGSPGLGSGWLCEHAALGADIALRIRTNPNFHPPQRGVPMILIGNGTGIAGLRAHLKARVAAGESRNWLLFGERQAAHDFLYRDEILQWQADGHLPRVDLAFSRDQAQRVYVQDLLRQHASVLRAWIDEGASVYVCGSLEGMAPGVDATLREVLGSERVEALLVAGRYRRDVY